MFHILLLNKQRAPRNNICSQSELTLPSAPPCQPGPLHAARGAEGPPPPRWKPGCCGGQWDSVHHTGQGGQDVSTLLPGNGLIHLIRSKVRHWWITRVEVEHKHDAVPFKIWPVNDPFKGADRAKVNKHETLGKRTWALSSASGHQRTCFNALLYFFLTLCHKEKSIFCFFFFNLLRFSEIGWYNVHNSKSSCGDITKGCNIFLNWVSWRIQPGLTPSKHVKGPIKHF